MKEREEKTKEKIEFLVKVTDGLMWWIGSIPSLIIHSIIFISAFLLPLFGLVAFDKMLLVLTTVLSLEAIYLAIFIQMSVNRIQSGKILRLRNKGVPNINGYGTGDLLVHVNVWTPKNLNKEQKEFFTRMLDDENFTPQPEKSDKSFFEKVRDMFS